ncbi:MAG: polyprenyl synthetase family protein [Clostridia bacterium]|jgi:heptaprenyl diphosphate synthase|nr:polyprenyl synthetase family protein [Clostridia bacterium]MDH7573422.1 polyprenyl synthetase family protein [Clostridia bacterium]
MPEFLKFIEEDLRQVEAELERQIAGIGIPVLAEASAHLLTAGGKRLRPALALLAGRLCNASVRRLLPLAVALELIHMATLVHDDVVDESPTRRGRPTVRARWGDQLSLHTGDYLFARSLVLVAQYQDHRIASSLARVSVNMCQGEIRQMASEYDVRQGLKDYLSRIKAKTALLISASCALGSLVAGAAEEVARRLGAYGYYLGMAFQITDDILDLVASEEELGKPVASDLRQGILTLPTVYALRSSSRKEELAAVISGRHLDEGAVTRVLELIRESGALEFSRRVAARYLEKARRKLEGLPKGQPLEALVAVADFVGHRRF